MKSLFKILPLILLFPIHVFTQNESNNPDNFLSFYEIYQQSVQNSQQSTTHNTQKINTQDDRFVTNIINSLSSEVASKYNQVANQALPNNSGPLVGTILDGLTKVILNRANESLRRSFVENLNDNKYSELIQEIFPRVVNTFSDDELEFLDFENVVQRIVAEFKLDMTEIPDNLSGSLNYGYLINTNDKDALLDALTVVGGLMDSTSHPSEIIDALELNYQNESLTSYSNYLQTLKVISRIFMSGEPEFGWINKSKVDSIFRNSLSRQVFISTVAKQLDDVKIENINVGNKLQELVNQNNYRELSAFLWKMGTLFNKIDGRIVSSRNERLKKKTYQDYIFLFSQLITNYETFKTILGIKKKNNEVEKYLSLIHGACQIASGLVVKNYIDISRGSLHLLESFSKADNNTKLEKTVKYVEKYGLFLASIATADSTQDLSVLIDQVILPYGSHKVKRNRGFSAGLDALPGFNFRKQAGYDDLGIALPIGVSFATKYPNKLIGLGAFVQLLDLGALAAFRVHNTEDVQLNYDIGFSEILAPGLYGTVNINKLPISLWAGGQFPADLRELSINTPQVNMNRKFRFSCGLSVDVPLLKLYTTVN